MTIDAASHWLVRACAAASALVFACLLLGCRTRVDAPTCASDRDCRAGEPCIDGLCQACRSDADCEPLRCVEFRCEAPPPDACESEHDCEPGLLCVASSCQPCHEDEACPSKLCHPSGRCEPLPCVSDDACPTAEICDGGQCIRAASSSDEGPCGPSVIHFARDSAKLSPTQQQRLADATDCLQARVDAGAQLEITAPDEQLGRRRADTLRSFLLGRGLPEAKLHVSTGEVDEPETVRLRVE